MWELRWSLGIEIELESFCPSFASSAGSDSLYGAGEEGFWTGGESDWLVYVSHENSITLAGAWLVSAFENAVPGSASLTFLGQIPTADRRGRWSVTAPVRTEKVRSRTNSTPAHPPVKPDHVPDHQQPMLGVLR